MPRIKDITITPDMLNKIAEIDQFMGSWHAGALNLTPAELKVMKRVATIESVGSSNRIEGNKMTDAEIEELFSNINKKSFSSRDEEEVAGYSDLINTIFENYEDKCGACFCFATKFFYGCKQQSANQSAFLFAIRSIYNRRQNSVTCFCA